MQGVREYLYEWIVPSVLLFYLVDSEKASCYLSRRLSLLAEGWLLSVLSSILVSDDKNLFRTSLMRTWCQGSSH